MIDDSMPRLDASRGARLAVDAIAARSSQAGARACASGLVSNSQLRRFL
jgi:hypothetical protein